MSVLKLEAKLENLKKVMAFADEKLEALNCPMKKQLQLDVALEELFVNIAHYAYAGKSGDVEIRVETEENPRAVKIILIDSGEPFNPLKRSVPDISLPVHQRQIGGLGIYLARKNTDGMEYRYEDGKNILTFRKLL